MTKNETDAAYFDWMCGLVAKDFKDGGRQYRNLLETESTSATRFRWIPTERQTALTCDTVLAMKRTSETMLSQDIWMTIRAVCWK